MPKTIDQLGKMTMGLKAGDIKEPEATKSYGKQTLHPKLTKERLSVLERTLYDITKSAYESHLRRQLLGRVRENRDMMYERDLGFQDFPFDNASSVNVPTIATAIDNMLDDMVITALNTYPKIDLMPFNEKKELDTDEKKELQDKFEKDVKIGKWDYANFYNNFFSRLLVDGMVGSRVVKEKTYDSEMQTKTYQEWRDDKDYEKYYEKQIAEQEGIDEVDPDLISPNFMYTCKVRTETIRSRVTWHTIEELVFNQDMESDKYSDLIGVRKWLSVDELKRYAKAGVYMDHKVEYITQLVRTDQMKKHRDVFGSSTHEQQSDDFMINTLIGRQSIEVVEAYINFDIDNDGYDELCLVEYAYINGIESASQAIVLRATEYDKKYPPIVVSTFDKRNKMVLTCLSAADSIFALHMVINRTVNANLDNMMLQNTMIITYVAGSNWDADDYIIAPTAHWPVENQGDVKVERFPELKNSSFEIEQRANSYVQNRLSQNPMAPTGESNKASNTTFRGLATMEAKGGKKIERRLRLLTPHLDRIHQMWFDNEYGRNDLRVMVNVNMFNISKDVNLQVTERLMGLLLSNPAFVQANPAGMRDATERIFDAVGYKGFDELWPEGNIAQPPGEEETAGIPLEALSQPTGAGGVTGGAQQTPQGELGVA